MFPKVISVQAVEKYKLKLSYSDGVEGTVDLANLAGKGVFQQWEQGDLFFQAHLDPETNAIVWNAILDVCPDNLYLQLKGLTFDEYKRQKLSHASS